MHIYRTLLILEKEKDRWRFLYGHSIEWRMTPIDYKVDEWKRHNVSKDVYAFFVDLPDSDGLEQMIENNRICFSCRGVEHEIEVGFDHKESFLLDMSFEGEKEFSPFMGFCSHATIYFPEDSSLGFIDDFCENAKVLQKIKDCYGISFMRHKEILETFCFYTPARLEHSIRLTQDKLGVEFQLHDYFDLYFDTSVELTFESDGEFWSESFPFTKKKKVLDLGFDPDRVKLKLNRGGEDVYVMENAFVKKVNVSMRYNVGPRLDVDGEIVDRFGVSSFEVGD